jgi:hypothetical protein
MRNKFEIILIILFGVSLVTNTLFLLKGVEGLLNYHRAFSLIYFGQSAVVVFALLIAINKMVNIIIKDNINS